MRFLRWTLRSATCALLIGACGEGREAEPGTRRDASQTDGGGALDAASDASSGAPAWDNPRQQDADCSGLQAQRIAVCGQADAESNAGGGSRSLVLTGTVEEITGDPWRCLGAWGYSDGYVGASSWRFRISDGTTNYWIGVSLATRLFALGEEVSVDFNQSMDVHSASARLIVRRADGSLALWVQKGGLNDAANPPEITVTDAGQPCTFVGTCGTYERDAFRVQAGGESAVVPYGGEREIGNYVVLHGGNDRLTANTCLDGVSPGAAVAVYQRLQVRDSLDAGSEDDAGTR